MVVTMNFAIEEIMKTEIGYKVVGKNLKSVIMESGIDPIHQKYSIQYIENEWILPRDKNMPIMIFKDPRDATLFIHHERIEGLMYECEYVKSKKRWGWCLYSVDFYLNLKKNRKKLIFQRALPFGTILADKVKLTKKIDYQLFI